MSDRWGRRLFTTGGVVLVLLGLVHSISLFQELAPANDTERQLLGLMNSYKFDLMGSSRSMENLLTGFSISFMLAALGFGALTLLLRRERAGLLKPVALCNAAWLAAMLADSLRYFFVMPTVCLGLAFAIFVVAWWKLPAGENG
jgi:hypothetical protein